MARGINGNISDSTIAYIHGRIEREIEQISLATGIPFSFITERVAELLHPHRHQRGIENQVPLLRDGTTGYSGTVATLEVVNDSHNHASPSKRGSEVSKNHKSKMSDAAKKRWANMPKAKKKALQDKMYKTKYGVDRKLTKTSRKNAEKQRIYQARHAAKKRGEVLPPLPDPVPTAA